jgi:hypothetical protein
MDLEALRSWLSDPIALQIAAVGAGFAPESTRCFGVKLDAQGSLSVGVVEAQAPRLLAALRNSGRAAVNLTHPLTFHGRQIKGTLLEIEEPSIEAAAAARDYFSRFTVALGQIGLSAEQCRGLFHTGPTRWVRLQAEQLFDQTPGPTAGARL